MRSTIKKGRNVIQEDGVGQFFSKSLQHINRPLWNTFTSRRPVGTNIFDKDWDLLVILDACRVDALRIQSENISYIDNMGEILSVGSMSAEWMLNTFTEEYREDISESVLLCRNNWSDKVLVDKVHERSETDYTHLHQGIPDWNPVSSDVFKHYELVRGVANHEDRGLHPDSNVVPHIITDRAIAIGRQMDFDRMIVHYNSPHLRYTANAVDWEPGETTIGKLMAGPEPIRDLKREEKSFKPAIRGKVSRDTVFDLYLNELQFILEYVGILLENIDVNKVAITADHGEGFGEMGVWGHPFGWPFAPVKTVPWAETSANDEETYETQYKPLKRRPNEQEQREFLENMGYL